MTNITRNNAPTTTNAAELDESLEPLDPPTDPSPLAATIMAKNSAIMNAICMSESNRRAANRDPIPAIASSNRTPSGVTTAKRFSKRASVTTATVTQ